MTESKQLLRQWRLLQRLSETPAGATVSGLSADLGVTGRTLRRDLVVLQEAGFPLLEDRGPRGLKYWRMQSLGNQLDFSYADLISMMLGRRLLEPLAGTPFWSGHHRLLRKIRRVLGEGAVAYSEQLERMVGSSGFGESDYRERGQLLDVLLTGMDETRWVELEYRGSAALTGSCQRLGPLGMIWHNGSLYLLAWSEKRGEVRNYKVDRMGAARLSVEEPTTFTRPVNFNLEDWQKRAFGVYHGDGERTWEVRILFQPDAARYVSESWWHSSQRRIVRDDGCLELQLELGELSAVSKWILSFGARAQVLAPPELQQLIRDEATAILSGLEGEQV